MPGVVVSFIVTSGGGAVTPASRITQTDGTARVQGWTLGSAGGANSIVAKVTGLQAVAFTATAVAAPVSTPSRVDAVTTLSQEAPAGAGVPNPPGVRVVDQNNAPMSGVSIRLSVVSGGGTIDPETRVTDANGVVRANSWVLGTAAGPNSVRATVAGSSTGANPTAVLFNATGISIPKTVQAASALSQNGFTGNAAPQPPAVVVRDQSGNPIAGVSVSFTASAAGGSISPATKVTGSDGVARATTWTLGPTVGTNTVAARVNGLATSVVFTAAVLQASVTAGISISPPAPTAAQPGTDPTFTAAVPPPRLTEEILAWRGESTPWVGASTLDCDQFGPKYVMVAIAGKMGDAIDLIRIACSEVVGGALNDNYRWTSNIGGDILTTENLAADFVRSCPDDQAIVGVEGTIKYTQVRGIRIRCRLITAAGLTSGTISRQPLAGGAGTAWGPDDCTQGRPVRAIRVGVNGFSVTGGLLERYNQYRVIVGAELHCEQPILP